jgi:hypothetical protein
MEERAAALVPKAVEVIDRHLPPPDDGPSVWVAEETGIGPRRPAGRHGTAAGLAAFDGRTGAVQAIVRRRHRSAEGIELRRRLDRTTPRGRVIQLLPDPGRLHCSAAVAVCISYHPGRFAFHWLPTHAARPSRIAAWVALLSQKCPERSDLADFAAAERAITAFVATDNAHHATPFTWRKGGTF